MNCPRGKLPPNPNSNLNPKPNPNSNEGAIFLGVNCPDTLGTKHLSPLTVSFLRKRKQKKIFSISPYIKHAMLPKFKTFWKCNFPLKLSREVVFCREGMAFIFITYSFYFNYYLILLLQKIITSLQKSEHISSNL